MLGRMIAIAAEAHDGQYDKGGKPYILHCLKVMHYLRSEDEELNCIAVGHDLFEDTEIDGWELMCHGFSERVINGIQALTRMQGQSYNDYKEQVFSNRDAMLVKMADLRHNSDIRRLKGVSEKDIQRVEKYMKFYEELKERV